MATVRSGWQRNDHHASLTGGSGASPAPALPVWQGRDQEAAVKPSDEEGHRGPRDVAALCDEDPGENSQMSRTRAHLDWTETLHELMGLIDALLTCTVVHRDTGSPILMAVGVLAPAPDLDDGDPEHVTLRVGDAGLELDQRRFGGAAWVDQETLAIELGSVGLVVERVTTAA